MIKIRGRFSLTQRKFLCPDDASDISKSTPLKTEIPELHPAKPKQKAFKGNETVAG
jgi:hypothetical protein